MKTAVAKKTVASRTGLKTEAEKLIAVDNDVRTLAQKKAAAEAKLAASKAKLAASKAKLDARDPVAKVEKAVPAAKTTKAAKKVVAKTAEAFDLAAAAEVEVAKGQSNVSEVQRAVEMGNSMLKAEAEVNRLTELLAKAKEAYSKLEMGDLPDLMREIGMTMFKMPDGSVFELVEDIQCGISEERRAAAHKWLVDHEYSGLIKTELKMTFGTDEADKANEIQHLIEEQGGVAERKEAIHPARLKSFVKEQLAAGVDIPFATFGIHPFDRVKYKQPKGKRP